MAVASGQHASARGAEPVVPTEAPHHGPRAGARGAELVVPTEAPHQGPRRRLLKKFDKGIGDR